MTITPDQLKTYLAEDPPKTAEQISEILAADIRTASAISLDQLNHDMNIRDMFVRRRVTTEDGQKWKGTVDTMLSVIETMPDSPETAVLKIVGDKFFSHITNPRNVLLDLSIQEWAEPFAFLKEQFQDKPGMPTEADFLHIIGLGGGYVNADVTVEVIQEMIDELSATENRETLQEIIDKGVKVEDDKRKAIVDPANLRYNNAVGWLSSYSVVGKTSAEVQAYVDGILNSEDGNGSNAQPEAV